MSIQKNVGQGSAGEVWDREFHIQLKENFAGFVDPKITRQLAEVASPPSNNMGGTYPLPPLNISQCGNSTVNLVNKTKIDWLAFTSLADVPTLQLVLQTIWPEVTFSRNRQGMPGYPDSDSIKVEGVQFGQMGHGASHGRNFVSLTGTACKTLTDELVQVFFEALSIPAISGQLSRLDLCLDLYKGELSFDHAVWAYEQGQFKRPRASATPEQKKVGTTKAGENLGRTMYVGKRGGHVMARIYEKGLEVFAKLPEELRAMSECREWELSTPVDGGPPVWKADNWLRAEVEYRRQGKDILLPLDMMIRRDEYFAGAYPYCASALGVADGVRPSMLKSDFDLDLLAMIGHAKRSYGSLVHSLKELGFRDSEVVEYITTGRPNEKLVRSGLLARIKAAVSEFERDNPDSDIPF